MMGRYAALIGGVAWDDGVMSQFSARPALSPRGGVMPRGDEVASFASYAEAQHAVDSLSDDGFPVQHLTIIGTDLRQVERITGRMSWGRAVASGAGSGLWIGLFFGAMMSLVGSESAGGMSMVTAVLLGVVWGIVFQVGSYALTRGRRDFTSVSQVVASRYSIIASSRAAEAAQARRSQVRTVDRSERIRTYNFPENRIADHRTGFKAYNLDAVLDGDLGPVIASAIAMDEAERLSQVGEGSGS